MSNQDMLKVQTCILKVDIRCACVGCEQKVRKLLQKVDGVYSVSVDAEQGKVIVAGNNMDPHKLIQKLKKSGKHAELWGGGGQKGMNMMTYNQTLLANQLKNLQIENNSKGGNDNKMSQKKQNKGGRGQLQNKGAKNQKFDAGDGSYDEFEDNDEFHGDYYGEEDDEKFSHHMHNNKMMPMMGNGGAMNKSESNGGGNVNAKAKKSDDMPIQMKGKGVSSKVKNGNGEKQMAGGDKKECKNGGGGVIGRFLGFGEKRKEGGGGADKNIKTGGGGRGGNNKSMEGKMSSGQKLEGHDDKNSRMDDDFGNSNIPSEEKVGKGGKSKKGNGRDVHIGQMGTMSQGGPMGPIPVGDYPEMQVPAPQYNPQQYTGTMMNQQQAANMLYPQPQGIYGRPHPPMGYMSYPSMGYMPYSSMGYMPPPPMPSHPMTDPVTHVFSDENTESCAIM